MKRDSKVDEIEYLNLKIINKVKNKFKLENYNLKSLANFSYPKYIPIFKFKAQQYKVIELGNMSILTSSSIIGLSLTTVVFTPGVGLDIPFVIIDFVSMKDKITVFVEFFNNHMNNKENIKSLDDNLNKLFYKYKCIENYIEKPNWYVPLRDKYSPLKKGSKNNKKILEDMVLDYLNEYLNFVSSIKKDSTDIKNIKLEEFIEDLIIKGNPSSKILKKALGEDGYKDFSRSVIFYY